MKINDKELFFIKEKAIEYYHELKFYYNKPDERMILSYCYTKSIVDLLKSKGLDITIEVDNVKK